MLANLRLAFGLSAMLKLAGRDNNDSSHGQYAPEANCVVAQIHIDHSPRVAGERLGFVLPASAADDAARRAAC